MQEFVFRSTLRPNQISFSHSQDPERTKGRFSPHAAAHQSGVTRKSPLSSPNVPGEPDALHPFLAVGVGGQVVEPDGPGGLIAPAFFPYDGTALNSGMMG